MKKTIIEQLKILCKEGEKLNGTVERSFWEKKARSFLESALSTDEAKKFRDLTIDFDSSGTHALRIGFLQGLIAKGSDSENAILKAGNPPIADSAAGMIQLNSEHRRVFLVHGHDNEAKERAARFLEKIGLHPIILHEQPNSGRTVIEKFETYASDITFAVVLLTPDDLGSDATSPTNQQARARQNVVMELGYFMGKLGRDKVCALHKGGIELPSDYQGVIYIEMDEAGAWQVKLAQEFIHTKIPININGLLHD